jgi:hypothetical protein
MRLALRLARKLVVLALAGYGAYCLYEQFAPRGDRVDDETGNQLRQVADTTRAAAANVRDDVDQAAPHGQDDVGPAAEQAKQAAQSTTETARASL